MGRPGSSVAAAVAVFALSLAAAGCSADEDLGPEQRADAEAIIDQRAAVAMIELSDDDRSCAVDRLGPADLEGLQRDRPDLSAAAEAVVECVGPELIGASVLRSQVGSAEPASLDCAVRELDRRFVVELVTGAMADEPPQVRAELEVARALSVCLELDELLRQ
jgi:hypothetical protein